LTDPSRLPPDEPLKDFRDTIGMVVWTLRSQGEAGLTTPVSDCGDPVRNRFGLFLVCAAHARGGLIVQPIEGPVGLPPGGSVPKNVKTFQYFGLLDGEPTA